jgi:TIR domain
MAFRVYLSHSLDPAEAALAWRLQTLATAHGIEMFVPNYDVAPAPVAVSIQNAIDRADCVLAVITTAANLNVQNELRYALEKRKLVIPIVRSDLQGHPLLAQFPRVFTFSPWDNPGSVETQIVDFLKEQQVAKDKQQAIGALAAVGLGLLVLFSLSNKE